MLPTQGIRININCRANSLIRNTTPTKILLNTPACWTIYTLPNLSVDFK
jgi:hypothetical protein